MALNEVASFTVDKSVCYLSIRESKYLGNKLFLQLVVQYPFVAKTLRDAYTDKEHQTHCCAMMMQNQGVGYDDLNSILKDPKNIEFIVGEIISINL